jgi:HK97 family phage major capsid protein
MRLLAILQERRKALKAEEDALIAAAEAAPSPDATLAALASSAERRTAIAGELTAVDTEIAQEAARRERAIAEPALPEQASAAATGIVIEAVRPTSDSKPPTPFASFGEQAVAIRQAAIDRAHGGAPDPRLVAVQDYARMQAAASGLNETAGSDGGFAVQTDITDRWMTQIETEAVLWPAATPVPLSPGSNGAKINLIDETSRATGSRFGGVQVYWEPEATAATAKKPKITKLELSLAKLFGLGYRTDEIGTDWTASGALMERAFVSEMAFTLDDAAVRGSGAGQPTGFLNAPCLISVAAEAGQAVDTVIAENVFNMFARMPARSKRRAAWYTVGDLWPQIYRLHQVIGTGGVPLFIPSGGIGETPGGSLLGRPVIEIEQASAPGDVGDFTFVDMAEYLRLEKGGIQRASSIHVEFLTDQEVFRWILRTNGAPGWKSAITPYKGTFTKSPFVALAAR